MTEQHTIYLTSGQVEAIQSTGLFDGKTIQITQGDLLTGGDFAGHIVVRALDSDDAPIHIDRSGQVVAPRKKVGAQ